MLGGKGGAELRVLIDGIDRWGRMAGDQAITHMELAEIILDESGYTTMWQNDKTPEATGRLENLKELVKALEQFENLQGFLEHVSLVMDNDSQDGEEKGVNHDPARRERIGISCGLPPWVGGWVIPIAAVHG